MKFRWVLFIVLFLFSGILILSLIGRVFLPAVTQEVVIEQREESLKANLNNPAPFFELKNIAGSTVKTTDFLGTPLVLTFWTSWNSLSTDQVKILDDYLSRNPNPLVKIIAMNNQEDRSIVANFINRGGYQIPVLLDEDGAVGELYQIKTLPVTYFIDGDGIVRESLSGPLDEKQLVDKVEQLLR